MKTSPIKFQPSASKLPAAGQPEGLRQRLPARVPKKPAARALKGPRALAEAEICSIVNLRNRHPRISASRIRELHQTSFGTAPTLPAIKRILSSCGMPAVVSRSADLAGRLLSAPAVNAPDDLWTVDFQSGWRHRSGQPEPIIVRDELTRFVISARMLRDGTASTLRAYFQELFQSHGLPKAVFCPKISPLGTGSNTFGITKISAWWLALGVSIEWKRPGHERAPLWNERPHIQLGFAWQLQDFQERQHALDRWRNEFNTTTQARKDGLSPAKAYRKSGTRSATPPSSCQPHLSNLSIPPVLLEYPGLERRRVGRGGCIRFNRREYFISTAFAGWDVALAARDENRLEIRFAHVILGTLDPAREEFTPSALL